MLFWLLACSGEKVMSPYNNAPTIVITSHVDGSSFTDGNTYEFWAVVEDLNHPAEDLEAAWFLSSDTNAQNTLVCDWAPVSAASESICSIPLSAGDTKILAQVRDPDEASGIDELTIVVEGLNPPDIVIHSPEDERTYYSNILIDFSATIADTSALDGSETISWTSSADGVLALDTSYDISGNLSDVSYLTVGEHSISLDIDKDGQRLNRETVRINVVEENSTPSCTILSPDPSEVHSFDLGTTILFQGQATDPDIPNNELIVQWSSDVDGSLSLGNPDSDGDSNFSTANLSNDIHTITFQATDEVGATCSQQMVVDIFFESQTCGNGSIDFGEDCDGANLNSLQCTDLGYSGGSLSCDPVSCQFDESSCVNASAVCGNGLIEVGEDCEGSNLNNQDCETQGFDGGSLFCNNCLFDTSSCYECGDGNVDSGEQCDSWNLNGQDCGTLGYGTGSLSCTNSCTFNTSGCGYLIDLSPSSPSLSSTTLSPSDSVTVSGNLYNYGADSSGSFTVRIYHSTNSSLSTSSDTQLDSWTQGSISGNSSSSYSRTVSIPSGLSASTDYIFVKVDPNNSISETDENNNDASASFTVVTCTATDYWAPTTMTSSATNSSNWVTLNAEVRDANSGGDLELQICKDDGNPFDNDIYVTFEEWYHYTGYGVVDQSVSSAGSNCSSWVNINASSGWSDGDGFGGDMQIVSPDSCASTWNWACTPNSNACGGCWFIATSVLTRTCKN